MNVREHVTYALMILHRSLPSHTACLCTYACLIIKTQKSHNPTDSLQFLSQTMRLNLSLHLLFVVMTFNPNVVDATDESSRGSNKRDHFSNDDATINNSPISFELLGFNEEDPNVYVRGRGLMTRDYFSNDDLTINSPISYEL